MGNTLKYAMGGTPVAPTDNAPHPCRKCGRFTVRWFSHYPKANKIEYQCETCEQAEKAESDRMMAHMRAHPEILEQAIHRQHS